MSPEINPYFVGHATDTATGTVFLAAPVGRNSGVIANVRGYFIVVYSVFPENLG